MGLVPTFFGITAKQRLLPGYAGEIPPCYHSAQNFVTLSEIDADLPEGESYEIVRERKGPLVLRACTAFTPKVKLS